MAALKPSRVGGVGSRWQTPSTCTNCRHHNRRCGSRCHRMARDADRGSTWKQRRSQQYSSPEPDARDGAKSAGSVYHANRSARGVPPPESVRATGRARLYASIRPIGFQPAEVEFHRRCPAWMSSAGRAPVLAHGHRCEEHRQAQHPRVVTFRCRQPAECKTYREGPRITMSSRVPRLYDKMFSSRPPSSFPLRPTL